MVMKGATRKTDQCLCIHELFEAQVARTPDAIAAMFEEQTITYRELNKQANQLAHYLVRLGVGPDHLVGILLPRSIEKVMVLAAIFKAGGAYVSLDFAYPDERLAFMIDDAKPRVVLTHQHLRERLPSRSFTRMVCLDVERALIRTESSGAPVNLVTPEHLAYVIYTSGSTGDPKGVAMGQRPLCTLLAWQLKNWSPPAAGRTLQFTTMNFDVAFQEIFSTWCSGGALVLTSELLRCDPVGLLRLMRDRRVERIFLPFVALQQLARAFEATQILPVNLRDVITAGEQLQVTPQIRNLFARLDGCPLHNQYGPAETHVVTAFTLRGDPAKWPLLPPIGPPVVNACIHILDERRVPVPEGAAGEIYIGGDPLARGYLNRDDLTNERFIRDPFSAQADARLYQTGDLGQFLPDGNIQYLGRNDQQVKIRGVRVELGAVEAVLAQHPSVEEAVVCAREVEPGEKRMVAYFTGKTDCSPTGSELRRFLTTKLPSYAVPSTFVPVRAIPLTSTGKVDRLALPEPIAERTLDEIIPPQNPMQQKLVKIWEEVLKISPIGIQDNFFALGGDSLQAVQIFLHMEKLCGHDLPLALLVTAPTIGELEPLMREQMGPWSSLVAIQPHGPGRPFFCVHAAGGNVLNYFELAHRMRPDRPFYALQAQGLDGKREPYSRVEEMAAHYLREIHSLQPDGPYLLGGESFGGVVAFEMAQQLSAQGEEVALLVLLDAPANPEHLKPLIKKIPGRIDLLIRLRMKERMRYLVDQLKVTKSLVRSALSRWFPPFGANGASNHQQWSVRDVTQFNDEAHRKYIPHPYAGSALLFLARESTWSGDLGWRRLVTGGLEIREVPGGHQNFIKEPHVRVLAQQLTAALREAEKTAPSAAATSVPAESGAIADSSLGVVLGVASVAQLLDAVPTLLF